MEKIVAIYKPKGPTSHDIVDEVRKITGEQKVGHAGTLDPLAEGVLVVGIGREATKKLGEVVKKEKEYVATIRLGMTSTTDDEEGEKKVSAQEPPEISKVSESINQLIGKISQIPPAYSAIKIRGKRAYKRARAGENVKLEPRTVKIKDMEILEYEWPLLKIRVVTGPGVYIRSLARDIGKKLNSGGYLAELERTRVGDYTKEKSLTLDQLRKSIS